MTSLFNIKNLAIASLAILLASCGRQSLLVPIHGTQSDPPPPSPNMGSSNQPAPDASSNSTTSASNSSVGIHSTNGWKRSLPIQIYVSEEVVNNTPNSISILRSAMDVWEAAVGEKLFEIIGTTPETGSKFIDLFAPLRLTFNGIFNDSSWSVNTGKSSSVLATTVWENDNNDPSYIVKASVLMNEESYTICDALSCTAEPNKIVVDMESLAIHELGHLLGLSHINPSVDKLSVMNPSMYIGEQETKRTLSAGDIARIRSIYNNK